jgi:glycosyltransferase involved in cell wall biosynthesis
MGTVYHGLPRNLLRFRSNADGYLAFPGRIAPEKRPDRAIEIAARSGLPLKIAAKVDRVDQDYWEMTIRPLIMAHPEVEFLGEIGES